MSAPRAVKSSTNAAKPFIMLISKLGRKIVCLLSLSFAFLTLPIVVQGQDIPLASEAFTVEVSDVSAGEITLDWTIAPETYMYQRAFTASTTDPDVTITGISTEDGKLKDDPFFGEVVIHREDFTAQNVVSYQYAGNEAKDITLSVGSQGCHDIGICYPPETYDVEVEVLPTPVGAANDGLSDNSDNGSANGDQFLTNLLGSNTADMVMNESSSSVASQSTASTFSDIASDQPEVMTPDQAFVPTISYEDGHVVVDYQVDDCCYLYRDKLFFTSDNPDVKLGPAVYPETTTKDDATFGVVEVFEQDFSFKTPISNQSSAERITLTLHSQGCADRGICYPPQTLAVDISIPVDDINNVGEFIEAAPAIASSNANAVQQPVVSDESRIASLLTDGGYGALFWFFIAGLLLSFTPCVFPMIPILSGIIIGQGNKLSKGRAFAMSLSYVLGMAVTYTIAGVIAGVLGANLQIAFQNPWVLGSFVAIFVLFGLAMFGVFSIQLPNNLQNKLNATMQKLGGSLGSVFLMGALSALVVGPCVAPPLVGILSVIATTGDPWLGGTALFVMSIGMGVPLLLIGTSAGTLLPKAGSWMDHIKNFFGLLMLAVAVVLASRLVDYSTVLLLWGALLILTAVLCNAFEPLPEFASPLRKIFKAIGLIALIIGVMQLIGGAMGNRNIYQPLEGLNAPASSAAGTAISNEREFITITSPEELDTVIQANLGRPMMLDFYADWCTYCKDFEFYTFPDAAVQQQFAENDVVLIKADITKNDAGNKALLQRFNIIAPPAILFFDAQGNEQSNFRLVKFIESEPFAAHLSSLYGS